MGDNWDDEDFEPDVVVPPPAPVEQPLDTYTVPPPQPQTKTKPKYALKEDKTYAMEDFGRELTNAEREEIQRKTDLEFARDLMGGETEGEGDTWENAMSKEEFEKWGQRTAKWASQRHKAAHYGDFLSKLLTGLAADLDAAEIRKMSNLLKQVADDKKKETDKAKPTTAAIGKKKAKTAVKSTGGKAHDDFEDYGTGGGAGWRNDDYEDDFM